METENLSPYPLQRVGKTSDRSGFGAARCGCGQFHRVDMIVPMACPGIWGMEKIREPDVKRQASMSGGERVYLLY